jgi:hypothetical protein
MSSLILHTEDNAAIGRLGYLAIAHVMVAGCAASFLVALL